MYNVDCTKELITEQQRILSFCYGYGGLERGVGSVIPIKPITYLEIEAFQNFNLVAAMEKGLVDPAPIWTNIKTFDPKPFHNRIHGFIGGYPCQGESHAGKRKLWDDPRFLWPYIEKCIDTIRPIWCFFENVSGHLTGSFPYVLDSLRNLGYNVEAGLFTASEIGAPHERKRLFILAMENSQSSFRGKTTRLRNTSKWEQSSDKFSNASGKELAHSCFSNGRIIRGSQPREKEFNEFSDFGNELSHTTSQRNGKSSQKYQTRKLIENGNKWPSKQGQSQLEWEEPRTVKPGMGCTVNGYNFRTELLRQYGNGVVSQQAAYAFEWLLQKHIKYQ